MGASRLLPVLVLAVFLAFGIAAASSSFETSGTENPVNETFTPDAGNVTTLSQSDLDDVFYSQTVVVTYGANDQKLAVEPDDYIWFSSNGTIKTVVGGKLDGESSATIEYSYFGPSPEQRGMMTLVAGGFDIARHYVLVGVVGAVALALWRLGQA